MLLMTSSILKTDSSSAAASAAGSAKVNQKLQCSDLVLSADRLSEILDHRMSNGIFQSAIVTKLYG